MPQAWRITMRKYATHAFDGEGSRLFGSRWTSPGQAVSFAAETLSLATLELLVHLQSSATLVDYVVFRASFPDDLIEDLDRSILPPTWRDSPVPKELQAIGDTWVRGASSTILRVPSAIIPHEHNYLINPAHVRFSAVMSQGPDPLDVDPRVFR
jgi:RES domain-containing protein